MREGRFPYKILSKYPHMKPADVTVWERFINFNEGYFTSVDYDMHIGEGADFLPTGEDTPDGRENRLYQRKIDVVGYTPDKTWIVEVKPIADMSALGQILTYRSLTRNKAEFGEEPRFAVVCEEVSNEMKAVFQEYQIAVILA